MPVDEALPIARQIAEALEEAHERGIVHRDLKPANVKIRPDGKVKVLDFGLAKASTGDGTGRSSADLSLSPTITRTGTAAGVILGTAAYMAPEQARGKPVDKRADIWAFGVVLFEMLRGRGCSRARRSPTCSPRSLQGPDRLDELPAGDARPRSGACSSAAWSATRSGGCATSARRGSRSRARTAEPVDVAPDLHRRSRAALVAGGIWRSRRPRRPPVGRCAAPRPVLRKLDITAEGLSVDESHARRSPPTGGASPTSPGARSTYATSNAPRSVAAGTEGARDVFWSSDSVKIGFYRDEALFRLPLDAAAPVLVARTGIHVGGAGACWTRDGRIVFSAATRRSSR